jgi:transcriptional regulator with PAS, ATPase and Fis domain
MLRIVRLVESLHRSDATVLITGESGTGKEIVARAIHAQSQRRDGPFVAVNCAALPGDLLESELFGHVRGAFTGAVRDRVGRFDAARGGVIFLDEIGDVPLPLQVKLLRVLQERAFERVGESTTRPVDARVIAATNVDLKEAIAAGRFRDDLYYRLRVVPIHIAPLRERPEDVEPLARHLLARIAAREGRAVRFSPEAFQALKAYAWPGNVRELENAVEYAVALCQRQTVQVDDLPPEIVGHEADEPVADKPVPEGDDEIARIRAALDAHRWHHARAAAELGISRTTLWRKMRALGLV